MAANDSPDAYAPAEIARRVENAGLAKARLATMPLLALAVLAGAFIALGALFYTVVITGSTLEAGPTKLLGAVAFSTGLILVVVGGAELFTGNNLIVMAWVDRRITLVQLRGVEERRGGLGPVGITPFPLPAHQTGRADFPHPASRPASPQSSRRWAKMDPTSSDHTELPEHDPIGETPGAARRHLVAPDQEMTNSLVDRVVDGPVSRHSRPITAMEIVANLLPVTLGNIGGGGILVALAYWLIYNHSARNREGG